MKKMKKFLVLIGVMIFSVLANAKEANLQEQKAVLECVKTYLNGITQGKSEVMKPSFIQEATIFGAEARGEIRGGGIQGLYDIIDTLGEAKGADSKIEILYLFENIAAVKVDTKNLHNANVVDLLLLFKGEDKKWRISSKLWQEY